MKLRRQDYIKFTYYLKSKIQKKRYKKKTTKEELSDEKEELSDEKEEELSDDISKV